jgi:hypothetical protein
LGADAVDPRGGRLVHGVVCWRGVFAGGGVGVCKLPVKGWWVGSESDELCTCSRTTRFGERNDVGEEKDKCQTR